MITIVGHWDIGYHAPITEQFYWSFPLRDFKVDEWWMSPISGIRNVEGHSITLKEANSYQDIFEQIDPDIQRVFLEPINKAQGVTKDDIIWLHDFKHPNDAVYVFGSAHYNPTALKRDQDVIVTIKTIDDKGVLWGDQCAAIVLYDRMVKSWQ